MGMLQFFLVVVMKPALTKSGAQEEAAVVSTD